MSGRSDIIVENEGIREGLSGNLFLGDNINVNGTVGTLTNNGYLRVSAPLTIGGTLLGGSTSTLRFDIANSNGSNITYSAAGVPSGLTIGAQGKLSATSIIPSFFLA